MVSENSIASEMLNLLLTHEYREYARNLSNRDAVNLCAFEITDIGKEYWVDTCNCYVKGHRNPDHLFDIFARFSDDTAEMVQAKTVAYIKQEPDRWEHTGRVVLDMNFIQLEKWLEIMEMSTACGDELMLFALNVLYCRRTVVYTENRVWTTVNDASNNNLDLSELHDICDVHLVFLGNYIFGELKRKPMLSAPVYHPPPSLVITRKRGRPQTQVPFNLRTSCTDTAEPVKKSSFRTKESVRIIELFEKHSKGVEEKGLTEHEHEDHLTSTKYFIPDNLQYLCEQYFINNHPDVSVDTLISNRQSDKLNAVLDMLMNPKTLKALSCKHLTNAFPFLEDRAIDALVACETLRTPDRLKQLCLQWFKKVLPDYDETSLKGLLKNRKIIPVENITYPTDVNINIEDYIKKLAMKQQPKVVVPKLKWEVVQILTGTHWTNIDPYSDIDEVPTTDSDEPRDVDSSMQIEPLYSEASELFFQMAGGHCLRKRTRSYSCEKSRQNTSKDKFHGGLCEENNCKWLTDHLCKMPSSKPPVLKGPSKQWLRAQRNIEAVNKLKCCGLSMRKKPIRSYVVFQPNKSKIKTEEDFNVTNDGSDSDETMVLSADTPSKIKKEEPVFQCSIKTKTFSLKKPDPSRKRVWKRNYRCPVCKENHGTLAMLNEHYKLHHPPLSCKDCAQEFCMPSALERHGYKHRELKYKCDD